MSFSSKIPHFGSHRTNTAREAMAHDLDHIKVKLGRFGKVRVTVQYGNTTKTFSLNRLESSRLSHLFPKEDVSHRRFSDNLQKIREAVETSIQDPETGEKRKKIHEARQTISNQMRRVFHRPKPVQEDTLLTVFTAPEPPEKTISIDKAISLLDSKTPNLEKLKEAKMHLGRLSDEEMPLKKDWLDRFDRAIELLSHFESTKINQSLFPSLKGSLLKLFQDPSYEQKFLKNQMGLIAQGKLSPSQISELASFLNQLAKKPFSTETPFTDQMTAMAARLLQAIPNSEIAKPEDNLPHLTQKHINHVREQNSQILEEWTRLKTQREISRETFKKALEAEEAASKKLSANQNPDKQVSRNEALATATRAREEAQKQLFEDTEAVKALQQQIKNIS